MGIVLWLCCLSVILGLSASQSPATNETQTIIPLAMLKRNGFLAAMRNNTFVSRFKADVRIGTLRLDDVSYNFGTNQGIAIGSQSIGEYERSGNDLSQMKAQAGCSPYDQVVEIPNALPNVMLYPSCVLAKQCGGCCGHPALACRPTRTEKITVQVIKYVYDGSSMTPNEMIDYIQIESHVACECSCKLQPSDCSPVLHTYDDFECKCVCNNQQLSGTCPSNKRWNPQLCTCQCATFINCGTGYGFNINTCRCDASVENSGSVGDGNNSRNPPQTLLTSTTPDPCGHMKCIKNYVAVPIRGGTCRCVYKKP